MTTTQRHILEHIVFEARQEDGLVGTGGTSFEAEANLRQAIRDYNKNSCDTIAWNCAVVTKPVTTFSAYQDGESGIVGRGDTREGALHDLDRQLNKKGGK